MTQHTQACQRIGKRGAAAENMQTARCDYALNILLDAARYYIESLGMSGRADAVFVSQSQGVSLRLYLIERDEWVQIPGLTMHPSPGGAVLGSRSHFPNHDLTSCAPSEFHPDAL